MTRDQEDLLDAKTIFKYKAIMKLRPDIPVVTELVCPQNLGFLIGNAKDYATMKKYGIMQVTNPQDLRNLSYRPRHLPLELFTFLQW